MSGIEITQQAPAETDLWGAFDGRTRTEFWRTLVEGGEFMDLLASATQRRLIQIAPMGASKNQHVHCLREDGVTAINGEFAQVAANLASHEETPELSERVVRAFGSSDHPLGQGHEQPFSEIEDGPAKLFKNTDVTPSIAIRVDATGLTDQRPNERRDICKLLVTLAEGCDITLVGGRIDQTWLRKNHRDDLPCFENECNSPSTLESTLATAAEVVTPTGTRGRILELLSEADGNARAQKRLATELGRAASTVSEYVTELEEIGLVSKFVRQTGQAVELTSAGIQFVEEEIAVQRSITESFDSSGHSLGNSRVNPAALGEGEDGQDAATDRGGTPVDEVYLSAPEHTAVAAGAESGRITVCDYAPPEWERTPHGWPAPRRSFDADDALFIAAVEAQGGLQTVVSLARTSTSPLTIQNVLTDDRLERCDFGKLIDSAEGVDFLRRAGCIGWISAEVQTVGDFLDRLQEAHLRLLEKTGEMKRAEGETERNLRGTVFQLAHGLLGVAAHLFDMIGVEFVREIRLPTFSRDYKPRHKAELLESLTNMVSIQSKLGRRHSAHRQMRESRSDKRRTAMSLDVDASDPHGELMGSFVIIGDGVESFAPDIENAIENAETHEDAPEASIRVPVDVGADRTWTAEVVARILSKKHYEPTREAVTMLRALTATPFDVSEGLYHGLKREDEKQHMGREIEADEVRKALAALPPGRICPDLDRSAQRIVRALCDVNRTLTTAELTEMADVSGRSLRRHREMMAALGLVERTQAGWRLVLSFDGDAGDRYPESIRDEWTLSDAYFELAYAHYDAETFSAGETDLLRLLYGGETPDESELREAAPWGAGWCTLAQRLTADDRHLKAETATAELGKTPEQQALPGVSA